MQKRTLLIALLPTLSLLLPIGACNRRAEEQAATQATMKQAMTEQQALDKQTTAGQPAVNQLTEEEEKEGWLLLFNGKDYTGWKCNDGKEIQSKIEFDAMQPFKSGGYLIVYEKPFGDFTLKFDVMVDKKDKKKKPTNSGLFFWIEDLKNPIHTSLEMQIFGGGEAGIHHFGAIYDIAPSTKNPTNGDGKWDHVELKCEGPKIVVKINDEVVCELDCDDLDQPGERIGEGSHKFELDGKPRAVKDFARSGYLGFQDHGDKIWVKNVKLLPLDTKE